MDLRFLLYLCSSLCLSGLILCDQPGTKFAVVFMQDFLPSLGNQRLAVVLTAFFPDTRVVIFLQNGNYSYMQLVSVSPGTPRTIALPMKAKILGSSRSHNTIRINSNKLISVVATNRSPYSTSVVDVSPIVDWGVEYYIMTPSYRPKSTLGQVVIINGPKRNYILVSLKGLIQFDYTTYLPGEQIHLALGPWESVQLQTSQYLSGSHLVSQEPVAVFTGRLCANMGGTCHPICLQLPPVSVWGSNFVVPPLPFHNGTKTVYILSARETVVKVKRGNSQTNLTVTPGKAVALKTDSNTFIGISSPGRIMAVLFASGGMYWSINFDGFLYNLWPIDRTCANYSVASVSGFVNFVVLVVHAGGQNGLKLNRKQLPPLKWKSLPGTDLYYAILPLGQGMSYNSISNPGHGFGLATIGIRNMNSYAVNGVCLDRVSTFMTPLSAPPTFSDSLPTASPPVSNYTNPLPASVPTSTLPPGSSSTPPPSSTPATSNYTNSPPASVPTSTLPPASSSSTTPPPSSTPATSSYTNPPPTSVPTSTLTSSNSTNPPPASVPTPTLPPSNYTNPSPASVPTFTLPPSSYTNPPPASVPTSTLQSSSYTTPTPASTPTTSNYTNPLPASEPKTSTLPPSSYTTPPPASTHKSAPPSSSYTAPLPVSIPAASTPAPSSYTTPPPIPIPTADAGCLGNPENPECLPSNTTSCIFKLGNNSVQFGDGIELQLLPGECSLVLAKLCDNRATHVLSSINIRAQGNESAASLIVEVYGRHFVLQLNGGENGVWVNGLLTDLPAYLIPDSLHLRSNGSLLVLETAFGLVIDWNQDGRLVILLPIAYQNNICGLCTLQNTSVKDLEASSDLYYRPNQCLQITTGNGGCTVDKNGSFNGCNLLLGENGPFDTCHNIVNPDIYYKSCQSHPCGSGEDGWMFCEDLQKYVALCQSLSIPIKPWRNDSFCPFQCPQGGEYELCIEPCSDCIGDKCSGTCLEGCRCVDGLQWDGRGCVPKEMCMEVGRNSQMQTSTPVPIRPKYLSCDPNVESQLKCRLCSVDDSNITTFGDFSSGHAGNGAYDLLRKCDPSAPQWLRIVLHLQPPLAVRLHVFFERSFITINSVLDVWVNGNMMVLPLTVAPDLFISRWMDVVSIGQPGKIDLSFNASGEFTIKVAESFSAEYCGACASRNSLDYWRSEDLSYW